jgi:hypothetical protein
MQIFKQILLLSRRRLGYLTLTKFNFSIKIRTKENEINIFALYVQSTFTLLTAEVLKRKRVQRN